MNARGKNVLVVDDEDYVREVVSDALSAEGFTCTTAANGEEALERLSDSVPERFVSVVSDISMPEMDGLELAHKIHELDSDLPIIILTGYPTLETARDGYEHGVYQYLTKPINIEELATCVERAAEFARLVRADKHRKEELELEVKRRTEDPARSFLQRQPRRSRRWWMQFARAGMCRNCRLYQLVHRR